MSTIVWIVVFLVAVAVGAWLVYVVVTTISAQARKFAEGAGRAAEGVKVGARLTLTAFATGGASLLFPTETPRAEVAPELGAGLSGHEEPKTPASRRRRIVEALASGGASLVFAPNHDDSTPASGPEAQA